MSLSISEIIVDGQMSVNLNDGLPEVPRRAARMAASEAPREKRKRIRGIQDVREVKMGIGIDVKGITIGHGVETVEDIDGRLVDEPQPREELKVKLGPFEQIVYKDPDFEPVGDIIDAMYGLPPAEIAPEGDASLDELKERLLKGHNPNPETSIWMDYGLARQDH